MTIVNKLRIFAVVTCGMLGIVLLTVFLELGKAKDELDGLKSELGEDEIARGEKELDALTRQHVDLIDEAVKRKEAELLEV